MYIRVPARIGEVLGEFSQHQLAIALTICHFTTVYCCHFSNVRRVNGHYPTPNHNPKCTLKFLFLAYCLKPNRKDESDAFHANLLIIGYD